MKKRKLRKFLKVLLVLVLVLVTAVGGTALFAKLSPVKARAAGEKAIYAALRGITRILPSVPPVPEADYKSDNFLVGQTRFDTAVQEEVQWSLGYARRSLLPEDFTGEGCYLGGFLVFPPNEVSGVIDDLAVRVICIDDGSGRGAAAFAVLDTVGLSNPDVREIREMLKAFAAEHNIQSINISATHSHSAVDTQGLWGDLWAILKHNVKALRKQQYDNLISGKNEAYMEHLKLQTAEAIKEAALAMQPGELFYSSTDELVYNYDKRPPDVRVEDIAKLRFAPADGGKETVIAFMAVHPVCLKAENTLLSGDYIYYMEEEVNRAGANFLFFQGAELAIVTDVTEDGNVFDDGNGGHQYYGRYIGKLLMGIPKAEEQAVEPLLNIRLREFYAPCENQIMLSASKLGVASNLRIDKGNGIYLVSEVGYMELGKQLKIGMVPGEMAPEIAIGGAFSAAESYTKTGWDFPSMLELMPAGSTIKIIGLCNDSFGYILPDNDFASILAPGHYEESVSPGPHTGSSLMQAFMDLVEDCEAIRD